MSNDSSRYDPSPQIDDSNTSHSSIKRKSSNVGGIDNQAHRTRHAHCLQSSLTPLRDRQFKIQKLLAASVDRNQAEQVPGDINAKISSLNGYSSICILYLLPWEIRDQIFKSVLDDYFDEYPDRRTLIYQNFLESVWEQKQRHFENSNNPQYRSQQGLSTCELPALEVALIPEQRLYREIFSLRIKTSTIELRPSVAWDWKYEFQVLSPEAEAIVKPPQDVLNYSESQDWESWCSKYDVWLENIWERYADYLHSDYMKRESYEYDRRGYMLRYPSLVSMSPLMLSCLLRIRLLLRSMLLPSMQYQSANAKQQ
jgi:hypothetical protein